LTLLALVSCVAGPADDLEDRSPASDTGLVRPVPPDEPSTPTASDEPDPGTPFARIEAAPLEVYGSVVRVTWEQLEPATVQIEYSFDDGIWLSSPPRPLSADVHEELLLGVPYEESVTFRLVSEGGGASMPRTVVTSRIPPIVPVAEVVTKDDARLDPDMPYVLVGISENGSLQRTWVTLIDRQGRVLWAHRTPQQRNSMQPRLSHDRTSFLVDHSSYFASLASQGRDSQVVELRIDGSVARTWDTPGQHHPFVELPDGSLAWARYVFEGPRDDRIEIIGPSGDVETLFSCRDFLDGRGLFTLECGANTISFDERRRTFLFSMFTLDSIFEIDVTGEVVHVWGALALPPYSDAAGLPRWSFDPPTSRFDYQHNPHFTASGTLLLSTHRSEDSDELVVREYDVDEASRTLREVWSFGEGEGLPGCQMGEAHRLASGNTLHNHGTFAVLREVTPEGDVVWDVRWEDQQYSCYGGPTTPGHQVLRSSPVGRDLYRFAPPRR